MLRYKYSLPKPNTQKYGRAQGAISVNELERLGIGSIRGKKVAHPKRILPKNFRDDPFADPPPITEDDISDGMFSLLNRGIIPKDVDLSPAFERGNAPFMFQKSKMFAKQAYVPQSLKQTAPPSKFAKGAVAGGSSTDHQADDGNTFLTGLGNNALLLQQQQQRVYQPDI